MNNILSQKKEIKRLEKVREREEKEAEEDRAREDAEAKTRSVQEFEKIQMGLEAKMGSKSSIQKIVGREDGKILVEEDVPGAKRGEKRKFELDEDELLRIAREERTKARKAIDDEKVSCPITGCLSVINTTFRLRRPHYHHSGYRLLRLRPTPTRHYTLLSRNPNNPQFAQPRLPTNLTITHCTLSLLSRSLKRKTQQVASCNVYALRARKH